EYLVALHAQRGDLELVAVPRCDAARSVKQLAVTAVRAERVVDDAGLVGPLEDHRARAIAEQHAGLAVGPVDDSRHGFGADHERALRLPAAHELVRDDQAVEEPGAGRFDAERGRAAEAELLLEQARDVRED